MTIKRFIEAAIEGGWHDPFTYNEHIRHDILYGHPYPVYPMLLDPEAWKAVGRVAWPLAAGSGNENDDYDTRWKVYMHRMIDALAEGKTIEQYLETL